MINPPLRPGDVASAVAFFVNGIGDTVLAVPAMRALARLFPGRLTLITNRGSRERFFGDVDFSKVVAIDVWRERGARTFDDAWAARQTGPCHLFLAMVPWQSRSLSELIRRLDPVVSIGFFPGHDIRLPLDFAKHSGELTFDIVRALEPRLALRDFAGPPKLPRWAMIRAGHITGPLSRGMRVLTIHADTTREKMWHAQGWSSTLSRFLAANDDYVALLIGKTPARINAGARDDRLVPCYGLPLEVSCALVARSQLFIGVDSCMLHVADSFRVPGVGLFGPTSPREFGFRFSAHRHVRGKGSLQAVEPTRVARELLALAAEV